ncbi:hypothetical protein HF641_15530 [Acidithiobacillus ferridurans]|nr:hypothetical protein [Acidithiobacillus ferridurans]
MAVLPGAKRAGEKLELDHGHLAGLLTAGPDILYHGGVFFEFQDGIWKETPDEIMLQKAERICRQVGMAVTASRIAGMLKLASGQAYRPVRWNQSGRRDVCVSNGILRSHDGEWHLHDYRREDYRRIRLPITYNPDAECPRFERFLTEVFAGASDASDRALALLEYMGLSLTTTTEYERALMLIGNGGNGKSKVLNLMQSMVGEDYRVAVELSQLDNRFQQSHLDGKLINVISETSTDGEMPDSTVKKIISGETLTAERKFKDAFDFRPICKLWITTNHTPSTKDFSDGLFRRFTILQFQNRFAPEVADTKLDAKLRAEIPGVLNLVLEALAGVYERGRVTIPQSSLDAAKSWRVSSDQVLQFLDEAVTHDPQAITPSSDLYMAYQAWADSAGIYRKLNRKNFTLRLGAHGIEYGKHCDTRSFYGIRPRLASDLGGGL